MKLVVIAYIPPQTGKWNTDVFLANLRENRTTNDIILFSDTDHDVSEIVHRKEDFIQIPDPEKRIKNAVNRPFNVNNLLFLTALRIVLKSTGNYTHMLFLEADCRMRSRAGEAWDETIWNDFLTLPGEPPIVAGSIAIRNPQSMDAEGQRRQAELTAKNTRPNFPISVRGSNTDMAPFLFVYGAGGVYELERLQMLMPIENTVHAAQTIQAWDMELGKRIWQRHGNASFDLIRNLECVFSGWGDKACSEDERREMLTSGRVVISHQHKSNWRPT